MLFTTLCAFVSCIAVFVLKSDVKLQPTNLVLMSPGSIMWYQSVGDDSLQLGR